MATRRIAVIGAGVAGSIVSYGLSALDGVEVVCLERVAADDHDSAGTGLNIGPNAIKALAAHHPELAKSLTQASLPWLRWTVDLVDGTPLMDLRLLDVADIAGIRIRWAELYRLLRSSVPMPITFGTALTEVRVGASGSAVVSWNDPSGVPVQIDNVDLVVACDGRYSGIRSQFFGTPSPTFLGVAMYRILLPAGEDCPINDYGQWFNGPNRLLAFQVPGGFVYCAGSFPIVPGAQIPEHAKTAEFLRAAYKPDGGRTLSRECRFLVDGIAQNVEQLHWARVQEDRIFYAHESLPLLLLGDAAHPIVPTLGQGATLAVEDACVAVAEIGRAHTDGTALSEVRFAIEKRRRARAQFIADFSREASDTILEGADPVGGTLSKRERPFMARLEQLYRGAPLPTA